MRPGDVRVLFESTWRPLLDADDNITEHFIFNPGDVLLIISVRKADEYAKVLVVLTSKGELLRILDNTLLDERSWEVR